MLYVCLRFPLLGLEALPGAPLSEPCALIAQQQVSLVNAAGRLAGVTEGMSLTTALALCPSLYCQPQQSECEQAHWQRLALWAYRFSDDISLSPPNALLLEVSRSLKLFGNLQRLYRALLSAYRKRGLQLNIGLGNTPLAAELLSLQGIRPAHLVNAEGELKRDALKRALASLPCRQLPLPSAQLEALHNMGLRRLGDVLSLPRKQLLSTFDPIMADFVARLTGRKQDPRQRYQPADVFVSERQFDGGLFQSDQLRFPMSAMLKELEVYLRLRQCLNRDLHWTFHYLSGERQHWKTPVNHRHFHRKNLLELTALQLEGFTLAGAVEGITLECREFVSLEATKQQLFDEHREATEQSDAQLRLINSLQLRLGENALQQLKIDDRVLPEQQGVACPVSDYNCEHRYDEASSEALRPSLLLPTPLPVQRTTTGLVWQGPLEILQGPERLDSNWWQQRQVRDYYIARHHDHGLCWLFKDCLSQQWYLHGFFS